LIARLAYQGQKFPINVDNQLKIKKGKIIEAYRKLMPTYEIQEQAKEEEMFIQVA
jgi:hypothetical protein